MIRTWARATPDAPMLTQGATTLTWARGLRAGQAGGQRPGRRAECRPGDRVAFLDRNGIEYFEVFFGCALLGAVSVAVNWRLAPAEMAAIIEDAEATVLFFGPDYAAAVKELTPSVDLRPDAGFPSTEFAQWRDAGAGRSHPTRGSSRAPTTWSPSSTPRGPPGCPRGR